MMHPTLRILVGIVAAAMMIGGAFFFGRTLTSDHGPTKADVLAVASETRQVLAEARQIADAARESEAKATATKNAILTEIGGNANITGPNAAFAEILKRKAGELGSTSKTDFASFAATAKALDDRVTVVEKPFASAEDRPANGWTPIQIIALVTALTGLLTQIALIIRGHPPRGDG